MLNDKQTQSASGGALAIQAKGNGTVVGLTYSEARSVFLDLFKANFDALMGEAVATAQARVADITDKFLSKLESHNPGGIEQARDPGFQHALLTVQREHARCGDDDLGDLLVDLLVDRSKHTSCDIKQIVLNESIRVAPMVTNGQLSSLAVIFALRYTQHRDLTNHDLFKQYLSEQIEPFVSSLSTNSSAFQHLEFTGCGSSSMMVQTLEDVFKQNYGGLFMMGFEGARIEELAVPSIAMKLFCPCITDSKKFQLAFMRKELLNSYTASIGLNSDLQAKLTAEFDANLMDHPTTRSYVQKIAPFMSPVFEQWGASGLQSFNLTSVGMALAHANIKRILGKEFADLSIWIN